MWWSLDRALDLEEKTAVKKMSTHNVLRYLFIVAAFALICIGGYANPLAAFLGIMGLKASAYMQPFTKKAWNKLPYPTWTDYRRAIHRKCKYFFI